jgi:hypothetical protein
MSKHLFWAIFILLCIYVLPYVIENVIITNSVDHISETPLVKVPDE